MPLTWWACYPGLRHGSWTRLPTAPPQSMQLLPGLQCRWALGSPPPRPSPGSSLLALFALAVPSGHPELTSLPAPANRVSPRDEGFKLWSSQCSWPHRRFSEDTPGGLHSEPSCAWSEPRPRARSGGGPTFEEENAMVAGPLVHGVHALQLQRQAPPEAVHLCRLQGHQLPVPGQPPEVPAWGDAWAAGGGLGPCPATPLGT